MSMMNALKNLIRLARTTRASADDTDFPIQQISYMGKVGDALMWFPYGYHANIPPDYLSLFVTPGANNESRVAFPGSPQKRIKNLVAGEVVVFHPPTGSKIHFKADGSIEMLSDTAIKIQSAPKVEIFSATDVSIGDEAGTFEKMVNATGMAVYNGHTHGGIDPGAGTTAVPDQLMAVDTDTTTTTKAT